MSQCTASTIVNRPRTKYDIYPMMRGYENEKVRVFPAGIAFQYEGEPHFVVKLWMFPSATYYMLRKDNEGEPTYIIYSRVKRTDDGPKFSNPVGKAVTDPRSKTQLAMTFYLLGFSVVMSLFPSES